MNQKLAENQFNRTSKLCSGYVNLKKKKWRFIARDNGKSVLVTKMCSLLFALTKVNCLD